MPEMTNQSKVTLRLADGTTIKGLLNIGKYNRLVDFLNSKSTDPFLAVYEASAPGAASDVVIINRDHIAWAEPE